MTDKQNFEGWADRHKRMGLDEVKDNIPHFQSKALHSVEELEQLVGHIPVLEKIYLPDVETGPVPACARPFSTTLWGFAQ